MTTRYVILDTDIASYLYRGEKAKDIIKQYEPLLERRFHAITFVTVAEMYYGACKGKWNEEKINGLLEFLEQFIDIPYRYDICLKWGELKDRLQKEPIPNNDLWIAATAIVTGYPLITNNEKHFKRVPGLRVNEVNNND